ncbi:hypothetical protein AMTR_s00007p00255040, partial [Amborella trichopoda]
MRGSLCDEHYTEPTVLHLEPKSISNVFIQIELTCLDRLIPPSRAPLDGLFHVSEAFSYGLCHPWRMVLNTPKASFIQ